METSKVEKIIEVKEWGEGDRKTYYHNLVMENGDKINLGKKKHLAIGEELTYMIIDSSQEYQKAKAINPEYEAKQAEAQPTGDNLKGIKIGHAINNGVILLGSNGETRDSTGKSTGMKESIKEYAKMIYQISEELNTEI